MHVKLSPQTIQDILPRHEPACVSLVTIWFKCAQNSCRMCYLKARNNEVPASMSLAIWIGWCYSWHVVSTVVELQ